MLKAVKQEPQDGHDEAEMKQEPRDDADEEQEEMKREPRDDACGHDQGDGRLTDARTLRDVRDDGHRPAEGRWVVAIDPGITNMGIVVSSVTDGWTLDRILVADRVDICRPIHSRVPPESCPLHHEATLADRVAHFVQEYEPWFVGATDILIERQPLQGIVAVEQLIFAACRRNATLVSPRAMHKHFGIGHLSYERRKEETVRIAERRLLANEHRPEGWHDAGTRKHDIADAMCILIYWLYRKRTSFLEERRRLRILGRVVDFTDRGSMRIGDFLNMCRYDPTRDHRKADTKR